jgi:hypothetical protein
MLNFVPYIKTNMTKKLFIAFILVFSSLMGISQTTKYAYVDTEFILGKLPEFEEAQKIR